MTLLLALLVFIGGAIIWAAKAHELGFRFRRPAVVVACVLFAVPVMVLAGPWGWVVAVLVGILAHTMIEIWRRPKDRATPIRERTSYSERDLEAVVAEPFRLDLTLLEGRIRLLESYGDYETAFQLSQELRELIGHPDEYSNDPRGLENEFEATIRHGEIAPHVGGLRELAQLAQQRITALEHPDTSPQTPAWLRPFLETGTMPAPHPAASLQRLHELTRQRLGGAEGPVARIAPVSHTRRGLHACGVLLARVIAVLLPLSRRANRRIAAWQNPVAPAPAPQPDVPRDHTPEDASLARPVPPDLLLRRLQ